VKVFNVYTPVSGNLTNIGQFGSKLPG